MASVPLMFKDAWEAELIEHGGVWLVCDDQYVTPPDDPYYTPSAHEPPPVGTWQPVHRMYVSLDRPDGQNGWHTAHMQLFSRTASQGPVLFGGVVKAGSPPTWGTSSLFNDDTFRRQMAAEYGGGQNTLDFKKIDRMRDQRKAAIGQQNCTEAQLKIARALYGDPARKKFQRFSGSRK